MKKVVLFVAVLFLGSSVLAYNPQNCINTTDLRGTNAGILCLGAKSNAPVDCVEVTRKESIVMSNRDRAILCSGAPSNAPAHCANDIDLVNTAAIGCTENGLSMEMLIILKC